MKNKFYKENAWLFGLFGLVALVLAIAVNLDLVQVADKGFVSSILLSVFALLMMVALIFFRASGRRDEEPVPLPKIKWGKKGKVWLKISFVFLFLFLTDGLAILLVWYDWLVVEAAKIDVIFYLIIIDSFCGPIAGLTYMWALVVDNKEKIASQKEGSQC